MWTYRVVPANELFDWPSQWQLASAQAKQACEALQDALNRCDEEGWEYVDSMPAIGTWFFVFRREHEEFKETGIKKP